MFKQLACNSRKNDNNILVRSFQCDKMQVIYLQAHNCWFNFFPELVSCAVYTSFLEKEYVFQTSFWLIYYHFPSTFWQWKIFMEKKKVHPHSCRTFQHSTENTEVTSASWRKQERSKLSNVMIDMLRLNYSVINNLCEIKPRNLNETT